MQFTMTAADLPVLFEVDAAVIGGSFAGIACALELAKAGKQVIVIEQRTYMGRELTAALRPWLQTGGIELAELPLPVRQVLAAAKVATGGYVPLHPDELKLRLEDALKAEGIHMLYASLPVSVETRDGKASGLVIANKSGRQLVRCPLIVDTSETALAASLCGEDVSVYAAGDDAVYYRTLEFVDADMAMLGNSLLSVPQDIGAAGGMVVLREGYLGNGHVFAEFTMRLTSANTLEANRLRELEGRTCGMRLAVYLLHHVPAFNKAVLSASSHELLGPFPAEAAAAASRQLTSLEGETATRTAGVWSLFKPVYHRGAVECLDAIGGAAAGEKLARVLLQTAGNGAGIGFTEDGTVSVKGDLPPNLYETEGGGSASPDSGGAVLRIPVLAGEDGAWPTARTAGMLVPMLGHVDVLVVGGGSSGACASITAAGEGMQTMLIELNPGLGGTGTFGGVDSYWFGRKAGYAAGIQEAVQRVQRDIRYKGHKWNIEAKMHALLEGALNSGVQPLFNAITFGAVMRDNRVAGSVVATRWGPRVVSAEVVIDATGDGDTAVFAGADYVYGSEKDHTVMWYSLAQFQSPDKIQNNFTSMVDVSNVLDYTRAILSGRRRGTGTHDHGIYVATRESRHILGDVVMQLSDQLLHRRWPDVVNLHFSNHDVKGVSGADWVNVGLIPPNLEIEVPYRMLLPKGLEGILVAGKAVSATHDALPAIRMQADLENLGGVAALAAAAAIREKTTPRGIDVAKLQARLVQEQLLPEAALERPLETVAYSEAELEMLVASIEADQPLYDYSNMRMNEIYSDPIPFAEICSVGPRIVPYLERALHRTDGLRRIHLAQALAMLGSGAGVPVLIEAVMQDLSGPDLPLRTADIMYVQLPPDHGAMPDAANLLYSLAGARDMRSLPVWSRVAELLRPTEEDFRDSQKGIYYFVDAVCQGAERLGHPDAVPVLACIRRSPFLRNQQCGEGYQTDYFPERRAMLELAIGRALARCGSAEGYEILIQYLPDVRSLLSKGALLQLRRLSGRTYGKDPQQWLAWLETVRQDLRPQPETMTLDVETNSEILYRRT